jgi:hypothetical protein
LLSDIGYSPNETLLEEYEKFKSDAASRSPDYEDFLVSVCSDFPHLFGTRLVVLFDAVDECHSNHQDDILHLIDMLSESKILVYVTTRDHLDSTIKFNLPPESKTLRIYASDADIKNYLREKFEKVRAKFEDGMKERIIDRISVGANGM